MLAPGRVGIKEALNEFLKVACLKVSKWKDMFSLYALKGMVLPTLFC